MSEARPDEEGSRRGVDPVLSPGVVDAQRGDEKEGGQHQRSVQTNEIRVVRAFLSCEPCRRVAFRSNRTGPRQYRIVHPISCQPPLLYVATHPILLYQVTSGQVRPDNVRSDQVR